MSDSYHERERRITFNGVMYSGIGRGFSLILETCLALAMPALLGVQDYGSWVYFRSLMVMMLAVNALGIGVINVHYVSELVKGSREGALQIFKIMVLMRVFVGAVAGILGAALFFKAGIEPFGISAVYALFGCIFLKFAGGSFGEVICGERQFRKMAVVLVFQNCCTPSAVLIGYLLGGLYWIPISCLIGQLINTLVLFMLSLPHVRWVRGWPERNKLRRIVTFSWHASLSQFLLGLFIQSIPVIMKFMSLSLQQIAFVGLGLRLSNLAFSMLKQLSSSMEPSLRIAFHQQGIQKVITWRGFTCRAGLVFQFYFIGIFALISSSLVTFVWGPDYAGSDLVILACLTAAIPRWVAMEAGSVFTVLEKPRFFTHAAIVMMAAWISSVFLLRNVMDSGLHLAALQNIALIILMYFCLAGLRFRLQVHLGLSPLWVPFIAMVLAGWAGMQFADGGPRIVALGAWLVLLPALALWSRSIKTSEIRQLLPYFMKTSHPDRSSPS